VLAARGCWTAYTTRAVAGSMPAAKRLTKSSSSTQAKPRESMRVDASRCESMRVDVQARERRGLRALCQRGADRLPFVEPEGRDVDQADDVGRVRAEGGYDLPAVGVPARSRHPRPATQPGVQLVACSHSPWVKDDGRAVPWRLLSVTAQ
jgi:hypothetical protein